MLKSIKRITIIFSIFAVGVFGMIKVFASKNCPNCNIEGDADNKQGVGSNPNTGDCGYEYCTGNSYPTATTITITTAAGTKISFTVASEATAERYSIDGMTGDPDVPSALLPNGMPNPAYKEMMDKYMETAVVDGKLDPESEVGGAVIEALKKDGLCSDAASCTDYIASLEDSDGVDVTYEPDLIMFKNGTTEYEIADCEANGIKGSNLCENVDASVHLGTDLEYSDTTEDTPGIGDYDMKGLCTGTPGDAPDPTPGTPNYDPFDPLEPDDNEVDVPDIEEDEIPEDDVGEMQCGQPFSGTFYEEGTAMDSCGLTHYIIKTHIKVSAPANVGTITAGSSFSWGGVNSSSTTTIEPGGHEELTTTAANYSAKRENVWRKIMYNEYNISRIKSSLSSAESSLSSCNSLSDSYQYCPGTIKNGKCDKPLKTVVTNDRTNCINRCNKEINRLENLLDAEEKEKEENQELYDEFTKEIDKLKECFKEYKENFKKVSTMTKTDVAEIVNSTLNIGGSSQASGSATSVSKGSGAASSGGNNSIATNGDDFVISATIASGTSGTLTETINLPNGMSFDITCTVNVKNTILGCIDNCDPSDPPDPVQCVDGVCPPPSDGDYDRNNSGLNIIYRPISLTNPFPYSDSSATYRKKLALWSSDYVVKKIITNNREVDTYEVYNLTPMYTITLTPADIKDIRDYNKKHDYSDFTLECKKGLYCESQFLRKEIIHMIDVGNSCAIGNDWYGCDSETLANYREGFLTRLK